MTKQTIEIQDIPETMLWTLHNRAAEAVRDDSIIDDPKCLEIYQAIDYDYEKSFGRADGSHGVRSWLFDNKIREFLRQHPDGVIVNLGEGLETQRYRIPTTDSLWLSIDLPEGIATREKFITPDENHKHIAKSALDTDWFNEVPAGKPVFITAQGLFMYFTEDQMQQFIQKLGQRFPNAWLMFDYLSKKFSAKTMSEEGWMKTPHYRTPPMPWGINRNTIKTIFSQWLAKPVSVEDVVFLFPRGWRRWVILIIEKIPPIRNKFPGVVFIKLPS